MPKIICVDCQAEYVPAKNGAYLIETFTPERLPYKIWMTDALRCPVCGTVIIAGLADKPFAEHYQPDFPAVLQKVMESQEAKEGWVVYSHEKNTLPVACTCGAWTYGEESVKRNPIHLPSCPALPMAIFRQQVIAAIIGMNRLYENDEGIESANEQLNHDRLLDAMDGGGE